MGEALGNVLHDLGERVSGTCFTGGPSLLHLFLYSMGATASDRADVSPSVLRGRVPISSEEVV